MREGGTRTNSGYTRRDGGIRPDGEIASRRQQRRRGHGGRAGDGIPVLSGRDGGEAGLPSPGAVGAVVEARGLSRGEGSS
ncbi:unnamed protein product [Ectocarpus sp. 12 AP-2014]